MPTHSCTQARNGLGTARCIRRLECNARTFARPSPAKQVTAGQRCHTTYATNSPITLRPGYRSGRFTVHAPGWEPGTSHPKASRPLGSPGGSHTLGRDPTRMGNRTLTLQRVGRVTAFVVGRVQVVHHPVI